MVSVVIPTHNRKDFIGETVDSVLAQTYTDLEVIVVDDGSTDGTGDYMRSRYADDARVRYIWQENAERSAARNRGIDEARGEFVAFLDSDDLWLPKKLELQMQVMEARPKVVMVLCWTSNIGLVEGQSVFTLLPEKEDCETEGFHQRLVALNRIISATPVIRKSIFEQCGKFCLDDKVICFEDWELWIRVACFGKVDTVPRILAIRRHHPGNTEKPIAPPDYRVIASNVRKNLPVEKWQELHQSALMSYWERYRQQPPRSFAERMRGLIGGFAIFGSQFSHEIFSRSKAHICWYIIGSPMQHRILRMKSFLGCLARGGRVHS
jgi:glycosyltransferase involved in cell wall biosynthesis